MMYAGKEGNILVTSAGRRGELIALLHKLGLGRVFASDMSRSAPALYLADMGLLTGPASAPDYVDRLRELCAAHDLRYIVPTIDSELTVLARARDDLAREGVHVFVSNEAAVLACFDKLETWRHFDLGSVPTVPTRQWTADVDIAELPFPIVVKPATGSSASGVRRVASAADLGSRPVNQKFVIQPFIDGYEVTIDTVVIGGTVAAIGARRRAKVRGGEVERGVTLDAAQYVELAGDVARSLGLDGGFNFQVFHTPAGPLVSDVNPRVGGGLPLTEHAGGRILAAMFGLVPPEEQPVLAASGVWMMRYDASVFSDDENLLS